MPVASNSTAPFAAGRRDFLVFLLCLLSILAFLFHKSLQADQVVFSNDGPLGAVRAQAEYALSNFLGYWQNSNWLGLEGPALFFRVSDLLLAFCCIFSSDFGPVLFAKIYAPVGLFILGLSTWCLFRQLRFRSWVGLLAGLAAALNTTAFSPACWGLPTWPLAWSMNVFAIAALLSPSIPNRVLKAVLAGFAVGLGVMEGFDVGAIFSVFTAVFAFLRGITAEQPRARAAARSFALVAIMSVSSALLAAQTVRSLIGTQVKGIVGAAQDVQTKQMQWDFATQSSLPKVETLRVIIPGLFGYRMPELYGDQPSSAGGSNYWGAVGQTPGNIQSRHSGMGVYAGVLLALVAVFGVSQSFQKKTNAFRADERKQVWCWLALLIVSLLLAWGRYAPFYQVAYALPYFSTIRNPIKFMFPFSLALVILFGYGLEALGRLYLDRVTAKAKSWQEQLRGWWRSAPAFDRKWTFGLLATVSVSLLGWLVYASSKGELVRYLQRAGFPEQRYPHLAESIAQFSLNEVGWFVLFLILSTVLLLLIVSGVLAGARGRWAILALGLLLVIDLGRADTPWVVYWNYKQKYATNPIIDLLRENPYQHRVTAKPAPLAPGFLVDPSNDQADLFIQVYFVEWLQHHFQYYRVQSLDIIQMPRMAEFDQAFMRALAPTNSNQAFLLARMWQLSNCRYLLGMTGLLNQLNDQFDPRQRRFRIQTTFNLVPKPGLIEITKAEHFTAVPATNGNFALFEFTGASPRAKLFTRWQVNTNDQATLAALKNPEFDPEQAVLVASEPFPGAGSATATNQTAGTTEFTRYEPKRIELVADAPAPGVLLLNDRFHPDWTARVDGRTERLLRCNYIMRGVWLTAGKHRVEFRFEPPATAFYVSLTSLVGGLGLCGFLVVSNRKKKSPVERPASLPAAAARH